MPTIICFLQHAKWLTKRPKGLINEHWRGLISKPLNECQCLFAYVNEHACVCVCVCVVWCVCCVCVCVVCVRAYVHDRSVKRLQVRLGRAVCSIYNKLDLPSMNKRQRILLFSFFNSIMYQNVILTGPIKCWVKHNNYKLYLILLPVHLSHWKCSQYAYYILK